MSERALRHMLYGRPHQEFMACVEVNQRFESLALLVRRVFPGVRSRFMEPRETIFEVLSRST